METSKQAAEFPAQASSAVSGGKATQKYQHLTLEKRLQLEVLLKAGQKPAQIAAILGIAQSTYYAELKQNSTYHWSRTYNAKEAHKHAVTRREQAKRDSPRKLNVDTLAYIEAQLKQEHSPVQISQRLRKLQQEAVQETAPGGGSGAVQEVQRLTLVSHETIYQHIYRHARQGGNLHQYLRRGRAKRRRKGHGKRTKPADPQRKSIEIRPPEILLRKAVGHWEGDSVIGSDKQAAIVTMAERATGLYWTHLVPDRTAASVVEAMIQFQHWCSSILPEAAIPVHTITFDNGTEFAHYQKIEKILTCQVYFAHPHHPWERGTNENTNGLLRQYVPKGTSLHKVRKQTVEMAMQRLNNRPRKRLTFDTPIEAMRKSLRLQT